MQVRDVLHDADQLTRSERLGEQRGDAGLSQRHTLPLARLGADGDYRGFRVTGCCSARHFDARPTGEVHVGNDQIDPGADWPSPGFVDTCQATLARAYALSTSAGVL